MTPTDAQIEEYLTQLRSEQQNALNNAVTLNTMLHGLVALSDNLYAWLGGMLQDCGALGTAEETRQIAQDQLYVVPAELLEEANTTVLVPVRQHEKAVCFLDLQPWVIASLLLIEFECRNAVAGKMLADLEGAGELEGAGAGAGADVGAAQVDSADSVDSADAADPARLEAVNSLLHFVAKLGSAGAQEGS